MKYMDEYRDAKAVKTLAAKIKKVVTRPWTLMEVCGGQTHAIVRFGLDELLPKEILLLHGPGCPVCVTPIGVIDKALEIAARPEVIFCSFGDMMRVPGSEKDLLTVKAAGGDVRMVYSPTDAVKIAQDNPTKEVVFFAVGFETTAPSTAMAAHQAKVRGLKNFSMLVSHVLVPPALEAILNSPTNRVQGFLAAGHVCTVMGYNEYFPIVKKYKVPIIVTGFEPLDILQGVQMCIEQLEQGRAEVENQYTRSVAKEGNRPAQELIARVFRVTRQTWRGIGEIPQSGLTFQPEYEAINAENKFGPVSSNGKESSECIAGLVLRGEKKPMDCPAFGVRCTPEKPLGAPMVSSEGTCAAYYRYRKVEVGDDIKVKVGDQVGLKSPLPAGRQRRPAGRG